MGQGTASHPRKDRTHERSCESILAARDFGKQSEARAGQRNCTSFALRHASKLMPCDLIELLINSDTGMLSSRR